MHFCIYTRKVIFLVRIETDTRLDTERARENLLRRFTKDKSDLQPENLIVGLGGGSLGNFDDCLRHENVTPHFIELLCFRLFFSIVKAFRSRTLHSEPATQRRVNLSGETHGLRTEFPHPRGLNRGFSSNFLVDSRVRHKTSEECRRTYRPKHCEYNNEDEDNSPNTSSDKIVKLHFINTIF